MSQYPGMKAVIEAGGKRATRQDTAERIVGKSQGFQQVQETLEDVEVLPMPPVPPSAPTVTDVIPKRRAVSIEWEVPARELGVHTAVVRVTRVSDGSITVLRVRAQDGGLWVNDLRVEDHTVELMYEDRWGRVSPWTDPVHASPLPTITDQISSELEIAAGQIVPYLPADPDTPSPFTTPSLFAEGLFDLTKMAALQRLNVLPFGRSIYAGYKLTSSTQKGTPFTPHALLNAGWSLFDAGADRLLQQSSSTVLPSQLTPFDWMALPADPQYVFASRVRNPAGGPAQVRVVVELSLDGSTVSQTVNGPTLVLNPDDIERPTFLAFARGAATWMRFRYEVLTASGTVRWNRNQLTPATGRSLASITEAPTFSLPIFAQDGISSRLLTTWDLTATRGVIGNLTVESAKMLNVSIEKLTAGMLEVQMDLISGGRIVWDGGELYDGGMELTDVAEGSNLTPNVGRASKITSPASGSAPTPWAAINFFKNDALDTRGISVWADGVNNGARDGVIKLIATNGNQDPDGVNTAAVSLSSSEAGGQGGRVRIWQDLFVSRDENIGKYLRVVGQVNATGDKEHGFGGPLRTSGDLRVSGLIEIPAGTRGPNYRPTFADGLTLPPGDTAFINVAAFSTSEVLWLIYVKEEGGSGRFQGGNTAGFLTNVGENGGIGLSARGGSATSFRIRGIGR